MVDFGAALRMSQYVPTVVPTHETQSKYTTLQAQRMCEGILRELNVPVNQATVNHLLDSLCCFYADEGTSSLIDPNLKLHCDFSWDDHNIVIDVPYSVIQHHIPHARHFARAIANRIRSWIKATHYTSKYAKKYGLLDLNADLGFDTADYCDGLSIQEMQTIQEIKHLALQNRSRAPIGNNLSTLTEYAVYKRQGGEGGPPSPQP